MNDKHIPVKIWTELYEEFKRVNWWAKHPMIRFTILVTIMILYTTCTIGPLFFEGADEPSKTFFITVIAGCVASGIGIVHFGLKLRKVFHDQPWEEFKKNSPL